ncbi:ankycorbin isoform X2 [Clupea harengus]|uniref:Ankycorbin isoform X2 n=1 Tax=Clupea harengus TaxID=7950 RepID=A0A8M1KRS7_CLUHA|nr:ankycorbin isoform X2 [Clupea harengus]
MLYFCHADHLGCLKTEWNNMKSLKAKFRKSDAHEWSKNDERLLSAVEHGEADKVASLLAKKGASAVKLDAEGKSALHVAALRGQVECLAVILAHGVDVSVIDASGFTALHLAAKNNHQDCAKKLIQSKSVVDAPDGSGKTALHHAAACGNLPIVQLLCEHKCPVNLKDAEGFTPLLLSARHAHADVCGTLVEWGSEVNARDKNGRTAVMLASESSCVAAVQVLVQRGADLRVTDSLGHNVLHYAKLSGSAEVWNVLNSALQRLQADPEKKTPPKTPQHDQAARVNDDRSATPKKRKAPPPPPISPTQSAGVVSPPYFTPTETPSSTKSDTPKRFNYKEDELRSMALKEEIEKLQEEKSMLLETIEDLKQIVEQTEPKAEHGHGGSAAVALVATLQAKVAALSLENQQLSQIIKKRPAPQGEEGQDDSRPNSIDSNASYHSTRADFEHPSLSEAELSEVSAVEEDLKGGGGGGSEEELLLLRETLHNVQSKLQTSQLEYRSLQARLSPVMLDEGLQERSMLESVADLQSKLTTAQEKYLRAVQEVQALRAAAAAAAAQGGGGGGGRRGSEQDDDAIMQKVQKLKSCLELEVKEQKAKLAGAQEQGERDAARIRDLESRLEIIANQDSHERESHGTLLEKVKKEKALMVEKYKEAQVDVKILQEAIKGMVPVEAAAKDFEALKVETGEVIEGLQRRLRELSKSYSETKSELSAVRGQLKTSQSPEPPEKPDSPTQVAKETQLQAAIHKAEESEAKHAEALKEIDQLKQEMEAQAQVTVALGDHTQVVSSLGSAIKELEDQVDALKQQLSQKALQVDALQNRLTVEQERTPDDTVPRPEHERLRQKLEAEAAHVTRQLQDALRKQDEMALEVTAAWQEVKDGRAERQTLEEVAASRLQENKALGAKQREAQDHISHLKKQVENHVASEREKNKKIDDLSKEVAKLKEALNSLSQLSYSGSAPKRQQQQLQQQQQQQQNQQNQQLEALQQQVKQLQYQLTESKKQHHEIVSVYRMHLLYAVQGQMDEDVQKALRQILMMCKMSTDAK